MRTVQLMHQDSKSKILIKIMRLCLSNNVSESKKNIWTEFRSEEMGSDLGEVDRYLVSAGSVHVLAHFCPVIKVF